MFNEQKAAQIAAWFLSRQEGRMPHLKLMKLMYLADRQAMLTHGFPMTGDRFVAMPHGPVLSLTLSHINDEAPSSVGGWDSWISDKADFVVALARETPTREDLDELSDADLAVMADIWSRFGHMTKYQIRDYTHDPANCPEWTDPKGSSNPIPFKTVFLRHGFAESEADAMARRISEHHKVQYSLAE